MRAYPFPALTTEMITYHRPFIHGFWRNKCESRKWQSIGKRGESKKERLVPATEAKYGAKIFCALKPMNAYHTVRRFRPFVRLSDSTRLPVGVAMRLRKP